MPETSGCCFAGPEMGPASFASFFTTLSVCTFVNEALRDKSPRRTTSWRLIQCHCPSSSWNSLRQFVFFTANKFTLASQVPGEKPRTAMIRCELRQREPEQSGSGTVSGLKLWEIGASRVRYHAGQCRAERREARTTWLRRQGKDECGNVMHLRLDGGAERGVPSRPDRQHDHGCRLFARPSRDGCHRALTRK